MDHDIPAVDQSGAESKYYYKLTYNTSNLSCDTSGPSANQNANDNDDNISHDSYDLAEGRRSSTQEVFSTVLHISENDLLKVTENASPTSPDAITEKVSIGDEKLANTFSESVESHDKIDGSHSNSDGSHSNLDDHTVDSITRGNNLKKESSTDADETFENVISRFDNIESASDNTSEHVVSRNEDGVGHVESVVCHESQNASVTETSVINEVTTSNVITNTIEHTTTETNSHTVEDSKMSVSSVVENDSLNQVSDKPKPNPIPLKSILKDTEKSYDTPNKSNVKDSETVDDTDIEYTLHRRMYIGGIDHSTHFLQQSHATTTSMQKSPLSPVSPKSPNFREQQRATLQKIQSNLQHPLPPKSPERSPKNQRHSDFVKIRKLPPKNSFSSTDHSVSPLMEKEILEQIRKNKNKLRDEVHDVKDDHEDADDNDDDDEKDSSETKNNAHVETTFIPISIPQNSNDYDPSKVDQTQDSDKNNDTSENSLVTTENSIAETKQTSIMRMENSIELLEKSHESLENVLHQMQPDSTAETKQRLDNADITQVTDKQQLKEDKEHIEVVTFKDSANSSPTIDVAEDLVKQAIFDAVQLVQEHPNKVLEDPYEPEQSTSENLSNNGKENEEAEDDKNDRVEDSKVEGAETLQKDGQYVQEAPRSSVDDPETDTDAKVAQSQKKRTKSVQFQESPEIQLIDPIQRFPIDMNDLQISSIPSNQESALTSATIALSSVNTNFESTNGDYDHTIPHDVIVCESTPPGPNTHVIAISSFKGTSKCQSEHEIKIRTSQTAATIDASEPVSFSVVRPASNIEFERQSSTESTEFSQSQGLTFSSFGHTITKTNKNRKDVERNDEKSTYTSYSMGIDSGVLPIEDPPITNEITTDSRADEHSVTMATISHGTVTTTTVTKQSKLKSENEITQSASGDPEIDPNMGTEGKKALTIAGNGLRYADSNSSDEDNSLHRSASDDSFDDAEIVKGDRPISIGLSDSDNEEQGPAKFTYILNDDNSSSSSLELPTPPPQRHKTRSTEATQVNSGIKPPAQVHINIQSPSSEDTDAMPYQSSGSSSHKVVHQVIEQIRQKESNGHETTSSFSEEEEVKAFEEGVLKGAKVDLVEQEEMSSESEYEGPAIIDKPPEELYEEDLDELAQIQEEPELEEEEMENMKEVKAEEIIDEKVTTKKMRVRGIPDVDIDDSVSGSTERLLAGSISSSSDSSLQEAHVEGQGQGAMGEHYSEVISNQYSMEDVVHHQSTSSVTHTHTIETVTTAQASAITTHQGYEAGDDCFMEPNFNLDNEAEQDPLESLEMLNKPYILHSDSGDDSSSSSSSSSDSDVDSEPIIIQKQIDKHHISIEVKGRSKNKARRHTSSVELELSNGKVIENPLSSLSPGTPVSPDSDEVFTNLYAQGRFAGSSSVSPRVVHKK
ncbi:unnamed protein product [Owenia fusiformis]|uniref:Uncharacterized protein n=1 Tax=Owenia fusiformis TaxID=6347 RepID=A0A8S4NJE8_OWEFU|nr:unnamed protein product [Owenia fusiformis]